MGTELVPETSVKFRILSRLSAREKLSSVAEKASKLIFTFLLKTTCFFTRLLFMSRNTRVALPEDGVQHTETCRRNVVNIFFYINVYVHLVDVYEELSTTVRETENFKNFHMLPG
jgi:hypothetical protein